MSGKDKGKGKKASATRARHTRIAIYQLMIDDKIR